MLTKKIGKFAYVEASNGKEDDVAILTSRVIKFLKKTCISFNYHMYGNGIGRLKIYLKLLKIIKDKYKRISDIIILNENRDLGYMWNFINYEISDNILSQVNFLFIN